MPDCVFADAPYAKITVPAVGHCQEPTGWAEPAAGVPADDEREGGALWEFDCAREDLEPDGGDKRKL